MKKRTFDREIHRNLVHKKDGVGWVEGRGYSIQTHNDLIIGKFIKTGRKAYCRGCTKIIGGDILKFSRRTIKSYGRKGEHMVDFSYCLKCTKILMREEITECNKHIRDLKNNYSKVTRADKVHSTKRIQEDYDKERVANRLEGKPEGRTFGALFG